MTSALSLSSVVMLAVVTLTPPVMAQAESTCTTLSPEQIAAVRRTVERNLSADSRAIERVHTEGTLPHQGIWDQSIEAEKDWPLMRQLAMLWQDEHRPGDAAALSRLLRDWAHTYHPSMNSPATKPLLRW